MSLPFPDVGVRDDVVALRRWRRDDLDDLVTACQDPEIPRWTSVPSPYTTETGTWFLERCDEWWEAASDLPLAIVDVRTGRLLGATGVHRIGAAGDTAIEGGIPDEVGYWLSAEARGHGVATRAVGLLVGWCFASLDRPTLWLRVRPDNDRSVAVARRCGFRETGTTMPDGAATDALLLVFRRDRGDAEVAGGVS